MLKSVLQLRSLPRIVTAYVLGPALGLTAWWVAVTSTNLSAFHRPGALMGWFDGWFGILLVGVPICLIVETVIIAPLLLGFVRFRWRWLNGWSGAAIGFLLGAAPWLALEAPYPSPSPNPARAVWDLGGHWTAAGWAHVALDAALSGMVGLIAASVFRLIAMHTVPERSGGRMGSLQRTASGI